MSGGHICHCEESKKPIAERRWVVVNRLCNYSAFNGSRWTSSDYSALCCHACGNHWRTKAPYVAQLPDGLPK